MKVKLNVKEMFDAEATHVSLVPRGANTMPFKKVASADAEQTGGGIPMLNFKAGLKRAFKTDDPTPEVLAVVVKGDATDADITKIKALGFNVEDPQSYEGTTVFIQKDAELGGEGQLGVQMDERTAVVCSFAPFSESDSFAQNIDQQGFLPGFDVALSVLRDTVFNALFDADDAKGAASKVESAVKEFGSHITGLAKALPAEAFKMDPSVVALSDETREQVAKGIDIKILINGAPTAAEVGASPDQSEFDSADGVDGGPKKNEGIGKADPIEVTFGDKTITLTAEQVEGLEALAANDSEPEQDAVEKTDEAEAQETTTEGEGADGSSEGPEATEGLLAQFKSLIDEAVKPLVEKVDSTNEQVGSLSERVDATESVARKADAALHGTVHASANGDRENEQKSSEGTSVPRLIDTGMERLQKRAS